MSELLKKGTPVRLIQPVIEGEILAAEIVDDRVQYRVRYTDADGQDQERSFPATALEVVAPA